MGDASCNTDEVEILDTESEPKISNDSEMYSFVLDQVEEFGANRISKLPRLHFLCYISICMIDVVINKQCL